MTPAGHPEPEVDLSGVKDLQTFPHGEFGSVRVVMIDGEPWFVAKDVAEALGYSETNRMTERLDEDEKISTKIVGISKTNPVVTLINESGLYHAVLGSKKPVAVRLRKWVTSEVLPTLRKDRTFMIGQDQMSPEEMTLKTIEWLQKKISEKDAALADAKATKA